MKEKAVILRTLDIGADKQVKYLTQEKEENPALGLRGIRLCFENEALFRTQLRAIYRASIYGNLHIMFPMISSLWEIKKAKAICEKVRNELVTEGVSVKQLPIGVMIETPAAALISGELAREVDFFSVGTNDLIQYTLAVDRQNESLVTYNDFNHPALWKLLEYVAKNADRAGIWAGICGEMAANPAVALRFIEMGYTELSMAPGKILEIRKLICER
jgi:phosphotransferase system enzyme I (PtsI)